MGREFPAMARSSLTVTIVFSIVILITDAHPGGFGPGRQDWGYVDIREGAHMFYWLYYTTARVDNYTQRPLIIWLQGGPGVSSTGFGNFEEIGPLDLNLKLRNHTWVKDMNVLFIDNPVGSGFSYVDDKKYLATDNKIIATDLVEFMKEFYRLHPEFILVPLHIFGESYGGKMAVEFALELDRAVKNSEIHSNVKSVVLGDAWIAPIVSVLSMGPFLLNMGIVDQNGYEEIMREAVKAEQALNARNFKLASSTTEMIWIKLAKYVDYYNILTPISTQQSAFNIKSLQHEVGVMHRGSTRSNQDDRDLMLDNLMRGPVSAALNISSRVIWGSQSMRTFMTLSEDFMKPVVHIVEQLLDTTEFEVIVFTGQLDLICSTPATVAWVDSLKWKMSEQYATSPRMIMNVKGIIEGYIKKAGKLSFYWVNRAGHTVPAENPAAMDYILKQVTKYHQTNEIM